MKQFPRSLLLILASLYGFTLLGQAEFRPGYYVDLNQDTIYGQIDYRGDMRNASLCSFRAGNRSEILSFTPGQIEAYRFTDGKLYVSQSLGEDQESLFFECLVDGVVTLYYYKDEEMDHYLIGLDGEEVVELTGAPKEVVVNGKLMRMDSKRYIGLLKAIFANCPEIQPAINKASLSHKSLIKITEEYHHCVAEGEEIQVYDYRPSRVRFRFSPVVGYSLSSLKMLGDNVYEALEFEKNQSPVLGVLLELTLPRSNERLSFQFEADFSKHNFAGFGNRDSYWQQVSYEASLEATSLSFFAGPKYTFPGKRIRPTLGLGPLIHTYINPEFRYIRETVIDDYADSFTWYSEPVSGLFFGGYVQVGLDIKVSQKRTLFFNLSSCYLTSNPQVIAEPLGSSFTTQRVRPELSSASIHLGIYF